MTSKKNIDHKSLVGEPPGVHHIEHYLSRDELLPKRQKFMQAWAAFRATVHAKGNVTPIKSAAA